jgi:hypothetical protein
LELHRFEDELEQNRRVYRMFYDQSRGSQIEAALQNNDADFKYSIVEPARVPIFAVGGSKRNFVLMGFAASLAVGLALVIGLEFFDQSIRSVEDIEKNLQIPVWGIIPKISAPLSSWHSTFKNASKAPGASRTGANNSHPQDTEGTKTNSSSQHDASVKEPWIS